MIIISIIAAVAVGILIGCLIWNRDRNTSTQAGMMHQMPDGTMMANNSSMHSMMADMMAGLTGKTGDAFDKEFLSEMIVHHEGAVDMAKLVLQNSKRPELIKLANDIISAQTGEITMMKNWQKQWFNQ